MDRNRHIGILLVLCAALAACEAPTENLSEPESVGGPESISRPESIESSSLVAAANSWTLQPSLRRARKFAVAATVGNVIYVIGGSNPSNASTTTVQAYNVKTKSWSLRRPLPAALQGANGASVINGRIYVSGGYLKKTLYVYNPANDSWARKADMPATADYGAQGAIGGFLYVYGGGSAFSGPSRFWRYNPSTNAWVTRASPPNAHVLGAMGVIGGKLYLAGGEEEYLVHGFVDVYDPATNRWSTRVPMPSSRWRFGMASAVLNGRLYVGGGVSQGGGTSRAELDVFDPVTNSWTSRAALPVARGHAAGAAAGGQFYVMGGRLTGGATTVRADAYTP
jgi:N-acetylneuraminic acid mutarotase